MDRHCKNCDKLLYADHHFCSHCGSKWVDYRLSPKVVAAEISDKYIGLDNKFLRTMYDLIRRPEAVVDGYIIGTRNKFMNPINFYVLSLTVVGIQIFVIKNFADDVFGMSGLNVNQAQAQFTEAILDYSGLLGTINLPIYSLIGYFVYKNIKRYNYTEHFIFSTYLLGFYNIATTVLIVPLVFLNVDVALISLLSVPLSFVHLFYAYHRIFKIGIDRTIIKSIMFTFLLGLFYTILIALSIVIITFILIKFFPEYLENFKTQA